jgi:aspartate/methionine/tyrosine aminotransferase
MKMPVFRQEEFFELHEFHCRYMLALSGVQPLSHGELAGLIGQAPGPGLELGYTPSAGYGELRELIAGCIPGAGAGNVLVTVGAIEALLISINLLIDPGDEAVCLWPSYQPLHEFVTSAGGSVRFVRLAAEDGFRIDLDRVRAAVTRRTRLVIINTPHNPTGQQVPAAELRELAGDLAGQGISLLVDEVFREMWADAGPCAWDGRDNLLAVGGLSKSYGLPGLRIGWLIAEPGLVVRARQYRKYTSLNPGALDQALATAALLARDRILARTHDLVRRGLQTALAWLDCWPEVFETVPPAGGGLLFPRLKLAMPTRDFCTALVQQTGVLMAPGSDCYDMEGFLRMGFATSELTEGLAGVTRFLERR